MKRAWPYALALAVVVTGCYLALAPLLRSLSPSPAGTQQTALVTNGNTITVRSVAPNPAAQRSSKGTQFTKNSGKRGTTSKSGYTTAQAKAKAKAKARAKARAQAKAKAKARQHTTQQQPTVPAGGDFVNNQSHSSGTSTSTSSHSSSSSSSSTSSSTPKTTTKTTPKVSTARGPVGGQSVRADDNGGFAGGNSDATLPAGNSSQLADNS
jgi:hypothetical protein